MTRDLRSFGNRANYLDEVALTVKVDFIHSSRLLGLIAPDTHWPKSARIPAKNAASS